MALGLALPAAADDLCYGHVTDRLPRVVPSMSRPAYLTPYRDPAFGSRMMRISDTPRGQVVKTLYSTIQAWNADESRLILYHSGGADAGHHLYDGRTYEHLEQLPFLPSDIEELFWDPERSDTLYFVQRRPSSDPLVGQLVSYDINSRRRTGIANLAQVCGTEGSHVLPTAGVDVHGMTGGHIGLRCNQPAALGSTNDTTYSVDVRTGTISPGIRIGPTLSIGGDTDGSWPSIAIAPLPSGERYLLQGSVFDSQMRFQHRIDRRMTTNAWSRQVPRQEHETVGRLKNGHDALFAPQFDVGPAGCKVGALVAHDLQSRGCRVLVGPSTGWGYPLSGIHHSVMTNDTNGWVASSTIGYGQLDYLTNRKPAPTTFSEITLSSNDADNPRTCRLAHIRTHGKSASRTARSAYFGEPHPTISPSGTRILFSSDWHDSGTVDTFVIDVTSADGAAPSTVATDTASVVQVPASPKAAESASLTPEQRSYAGDVATVAVTFSDPTGGMIDRVTIARAGSPDGELKMWLYTNGSQRQTYAGPRSGRLSFLKRYLGDGQFEARLFRKDSSSIVARERFTIGN